MRLPDDDDDDDVYLAGMSKHSTLSSVGSSYGLCLDFMHCSTIGYGTVFIFVML